jgi:putative peptidoglycan lipid II flippase
LAWIFLASLVAGGATWGVSYGWQQFIPDHNKITLIIQLVLSGGIGFGVYLSIVSQLKLPEFDKFAKQIRQKLFKK